jgi:hypothetical protein
MYLASGQKFSTIEKKQNLKDVALRTVRYSWRLFTVGIALLFTESVNSTNITVHILQCSLLGTRIHCNIFPQVSFQHHFLTQDCISQTVWSDLKVAPVLMHWDIFTYIGYQQFVFWYLMEERLGFTFISLLSFKRHVCNLNGAHCGVFGWGTAFQYDMSRVRIPLGLLGIFIDWFFWPHWGPGVDRASNTN